MVFWLLILAGLFLASVVLLITARIVRRTRRSVGSSAQTDFAIEELHALLVQGRITRKEFERARAAVLLGRDETAEPGRRPGGFEMLETRDHI